MREHASMNGLVALPGAVAEEPLSRQGVHGDALQAAPVERDAAESRSRRRVETVLLGAITGLRGSGSHPCSHAAGTGPSPATRHPVQRNPPILAFANRFFIVRPFSLGPDSIPNAAPIWEMSYEPGARRHRRGHRATRSAAAPCASAEVWSPQLVHEAAW